MLFSRRSLPRRLFGISSEEADFSKRGFTGGDKHAQAQLELSARTFIEGYNYALDDAHFDVLLSRLQAVDRPLQGFAFEGAAMGLMVLDYFSPWKKRLDAFIQGPGADHIYMLHVGAGWTLGILPQSYTAMLRRMDPLLCWLALDGYGFQQGFFAWQRCIEQKKQPSRLHGYAQRAFDQGLGRSLWFVKGADITQIVTTIHAFPSIRQKDLWSGVGLACTYAGGVDHLTIEALMQKADIYYSHFAQGATFAVKARHKAGNILDSTKLACSIICQADIDAIVDLADISLNDLPQNDQAYELWRSRIQAYFVGKEKEQPAFLLSDAI